MKKAREKYEEMASLRTLARKILGRKGTFMLRNALSGVYTYFLRSPDHVRKERGVTAMVCTYNEEDWVDLSLLSIKDLVREIVVVDSSTDSTPEIIDELKCKYDLPVKLFRMEAGDLVTARNLVLKEATCKWIRLGC
jgi:cellulose synthase/poly-beta-1,6-N-acetylglucosamine synthase-like glycosyltransferase